MTGALGATAVGCLAVSGAVCSGPADSTERAQSRKRLAQQHHSCRNRNRYQRDKGVVDSKEQALVRREALHLDVDQEIARRAGIIQSVGDKKPRREAEGTDANRELPAESVRVIPDSLADAGTLNGKRDLPLVKVAGCVAGAEADTGTEGVGSCRDSRVADAARGAVEAGPVTAAARRAAEDRGRALEKSQAARASMPESSPYVRLRSIPMHCNLKPSVPKLRSHARKSSAKRRSGGVAP